MLKVAHIVNVAEITEFNKKSYLHVAQPVTLKSMVVAKSIAEGSVSVELWAVKHKNENVDVPQAFRWSKEIENYAYNYIDKLSNLVSKKPLPRIKDIISSLYESSDADFFIYTNVDIGLYPDFYLKLAKLVSGGCDACCINRLDLPKKYNDTIINELTFELALIAEGTKHPGIDCFVFRRDIVASLQLGNVYVGFPPIGQVLKTQIELNSDNFLWIKDRGYTFHLGYDMHWMKAQGAYSSENLVQAEGLYVPCVDLLKKSTLKSKLKNKLRLWMISLASALE